MVNYMIKYADDTIVLIPQRKNEDPHDKILNEIKSIEGWCSKKGLSINNNKSKIMSICKSNLSDACRLDSLKFNFQLVSEIKILGVILNCNLNWKSYLSLISSKFCSRLIVLRVLRGALNNKELI